MGTRTGPEGPPGERRAPAASERSAPRGRPWREEVPWIVAVVLGATAPLVALLAAGRTVSALDSARLHAPLRRLVSEALRSGRLPLWNPYEGTGMPLFAQGLHGVLHPWSILSALIAPEGGMDLLIVLHVATGALGAGALARTLGASRGAASVAGLGFGLSGYLLSMSRNVTFLASAGTAPWVVAALVAAARAGGGAGSLPVAALSVAALHLAGDPQWSLVAALLGTLLAWDAGGRRGVARSAVAVVAGTALAGVQLVPSWAFFAQSARRLALDEADRIQWALAPWRIPELVAPGFFGGAPGALDAPVFRWLGGATRYPLPFVFSIAVGAPLVLLAVIGGNARRTGRVLAGAAVVLLWLALGHHLGAREALGWIPVWGSVRYAEKLVGPLTLAIAILAALGADALGAGARRRTLAVIGGLAALAGVVSAVAWAAAGGSPRGAAPADAWRLAGEQLSRGMAHAAVALLVTGVVLGAAARAAPLRSRAAAALATIVVLQGLAAAPFALHAGRPGVRDPAPLAFLKRDAAVPRVLTPLERSGARMPADLDELDGALWAQSRMAVAPFGVASGVDQIDTYTGVEPQRVTALLRGLLPLGPGQLVALRRFSITHAVVPAPPPRAEDEVVRAAATAGGRRVAADPEGAFEVWAVPHRPWASFAERVRVVRDESQAPGAVAELEAAGDPTVVLVGFAPRSLSPGTVLGVERGPESLRLVAEAPRDGVLVVNDAEWPGWEATIDGRPADIHLADGLVRAVSWPAGRHVLEMTYRPVELRMGLAVSGAGLLLVLALALGARRGLAGRD